MSHAIKIKAIETAFSQADNRHFLDVEVEVTDGEKAVGTRRFGYPMDSTKEFILEDLNKVAKALDSDVVNAANSSKTEADFANAESLKKSLLQ